MVQKLSSVIFHRSRDIQTVLCDVVVAVSFLKKDNLLPVYSKLEKKNITCDKKIGSWNVNVN